MEKLGVSPYSAVVSVSSSPVKDPGAFQACGAGLEVSVGSKAETKRGVAG
jgi:hypothetical protein